MHDIYSDLFARYWGQQELTANLIAFANIMGALILGLIVGYERSYNGRAAGMRTYGLVCMAHVRWWCWQAPQRFGTAATPAPS